MESGNVRLKLDERNVVVVRVLNMIEPIQLVSTAMSFNSQRFKAHDPRREIGRSPVKALTTKRAESAPDPTALSKFYMSSK